MGSTRTDYITGQQTPELLKNQLVKKEWRFSLADLNSVASDVIEAIKIPAGAFVKRVGVLLITAEGGALTCTVGDATDANGWLTAVDLNDVAGGDILYGTTQGPMYTSLLEPATDVLGKGKWYSAADTIDLTMSAAAGDTAVFVVWAEMYIFENTT